MLVKNNIEKAGRHSWVFPKHWHLSRLKTRISNFCRWKKTKHHKVFARKVLSRRCLYYSLSQTFCVLHCISQSTIVSKKTWKKSVEILPKYACRPMKSRLKCRFFQPWLPTYAVSQSWQQKSLSLWCILGVGAWAREAAGLAEAKMPVGAIFCQWVLCRLFSVSETIGSKITLDPRLLLIQDYPWSKTTLDPRLLLIQDYSWSKTTLDRRLLLIQDYSWSKITLDPRTLMIQQQRSNASWLTKTKGAFVNR